MTAPRLGCHCAGQLSRGSDVPHLCAAWSDSHLTGWRAQPALPAGFRARSGRGQGWLVATALFILAAVPLAPIG